MVFKKWWGYLHKEGTLQLKLYHTFRDIEDARESDFTVKVIGPFKARNRDEALNHLRESIKATVMDQKTEPKNDYDNVYTSLLNLSKRMLETLPEKEIYPRELLESRPAHKTLATYLSVGDHVKFVSLPSIYYSDGNRADKPLLRLRIISYNRSEGLIAYSDAKHCCYKIPLRDRSMFFSIESIAAFYKAKSLIRD